MNERPVPDRSSRIRIGDAERDRAVAALQRHHSAGRLTFAEFEQRMASALQARTGADLEHLFEDLPVVAWPTATPPVRTGGPKRVLVGALVAAAVATAGGVATHSRDSGVTVSSQTISYRWTPTMRIESSTHTAIPFRWAWTFQYSTGTVPRALPTR